MRADSVVGRLVRALARTDDSSPKRSSDPGMSTFMRRLIGALGNADDSQMCSDAVAGADELEPARLDQKPPAQEADRPLIFVKELTVAEVATMMHVSKMTVYRLVHSGELPVTRVGRSFRIPERAVLDYLRDSYIETG